MNLRTPTGKEFMKETFDNEKEECFSGDAPEGGYRAWYFVSYPKYFQFYVGKVWNKWVFNIDVWFIGFGYAW